jgi:hypothetical protein
LLGQVDGAHASFTDLLQELVRANDCRAASAKTREIAIQRDGWGFEKRAQTRMRREQAFDVFPARGITGTRPFQIRRSLGWINDFVCCMEDFAHSHGSLLDRLATINAISGRDFRQASSRQVLSSLRRNARA